jgi:hydrogenase nickel incorporation protein HypA/HybF
LHELSLSSAIVETVERHAQGRRVTTVDVTIGALRQVVPDSLDFYFGIVARGTLCEGARLVQRLVPGRARCERCGHAWELDFPVFRCERCGGMAAAVSGEELEVESIEGEEGAECTAAR